VDHGVETTQLNANLSSRFGRSSRATLVSGYDLRDEPRDQPTKYDHRAARITPISLDIQHELKPNVNLYYHETYSVFDSVTQRPVGTPLNTSGEIAWGGPLSTTFFSQGFNFTKTASGQPSPLDLSTKLKFYLSPKWYIDTLLTYQLIGPGGLNYQELKGVSKSISAVRDLHCWVLRMTFSDRPGRREAFFYIDLKVNQVRNNAAMLPKKDVSYFPYNDPEQVDQIFPDKTPPETKEEIKK
jgi:hypothetical protein